MCSSSKRRSKTDEEQQNSTNNNNEIKNGEISLNVMTKNVEKLKVLEVKRGKNISWLNEMS